VHSAHYVPVNLYYKHAGTSPPPLSTINDLPPLLLLPPSGIIQVNYFLQSQEHTNLVFSFTEPLHGHDFKSSLKIARYFI
jgi:hypothetical protein